MNYIKYEIKWERKSNTTNLTNKIGTIIKMK